MDKEKKELFERIKKELKDRYNVTTEEELRELYKNKKLKLNIGMFTK